MIKHTTTETFKEDVLQSDIPVLVDFWADWCGPCKMLAPVLDKVDDASNGEFQICKVNIDEEPKLAELFKVMSIPTLMVFKNGQPSKTSIGVISKDDIINLINA